MIESVLSVFYIMMITFSFFYNYHRYSTLIGVTGREVIKLPPPYSDCTETNFELENLRQILERDVPGIQSQFHSVLLLGR